MATGRLGASSLSATTNTTIYTCPADTFTVAAISICNRTSGTINARLAISTSGSPADADWIEYDVQILANGVLERTGLVLDTGKTIVAYASATGLSVVAMGIETPTV